MADNIVDNRRSIRPRVDSTALHRSAIVSTASQSSTVKLDIVASKVTMSVPSTVVVNLSGSLDGSTFFTIGTGVTNEARTYGTSVGNHLVKYIKVDWVSGTGAVVIAA